MTAVKGPLVRVASRNKKNKQETKSSNIFFDWLTAVVASQWLQTALSCKTEIKIEKIFVSSWR